MKLAIIGAGNIGKALIERLSKYNLQVSSGTPGEHNGISIISNNLEVAQNSDIILLAVKPQVVLEIMQEIKPALENKLLITFAAGIPIQGYNHSRTIRIMPTLAIKTGKGFCGFSLSKECSKEDQENLKTILSHLGESLEVEESLLDVITGISGSGIAYFLEVMDIFIKTGIEKGLEENQAKKIVQETVKGSLSMLESQSAQDAINSIACKGGTTKKGLQELKDNKIEKIFQETINKTITACQSLRDKHGSK